MMSKFLSIAAAAGLLIATSALGHAQSSGQRMPDSTPGQKMQDRGSAPGQPGASGYTPGHQMQQKGSKAGEPGASGYAPGHQPSTTGRGSMGNRDPDRDRGDAR
jgi:predicted lipid-binding transport protein (Tim44 family)